jgi:hypothetical protein
MEEKISIFLSSYKKNKFSSLDAEKVAVARAQ